MAKDEEDYGMCCSKEMAEQCAKDYYKWERRESIKEGIMLLSIFIIIFAITVFLMCKYDKPEPVKPGGSLYGGYENIFNQAWRISC